MMDQRCQYVILGCHRELTIEGTLSVDAKSMLSTTV